MLQKWLQLRDEDGSRNSRPALIGEVPKRVHAHDPTLEVHHGAAGVAMVDVHVGDDGLLAEAAHDPEGHGHDGFLIQRISERDHPFTWSDNMTVGLRRGHPEPITAVTRVVCDAQDREVSLGVVRHDGAPDFGNRVELHRDIRRADDDVMVGDNQPGRRINEPPGSVASTSFNAHYARPHPLVEFHLRGGSPCRLRHEHRPRLHRSVQRCQLEFRSLSSREGHRHMP